VLKVFVLIYLAIFLIWLLFLLFFLFTDNLASHFCFSLRSSCFLVFSFFL
jgi:hypothetical protein